jgi:hypothetical protein
MTGYEVPCAGGCGKNVTQTTVGQHTTCMECFRAGRGLGAPYVIYATPTPAVLQEPPQSFILRC